jgi:hypothetical protein
MKQVMPRFPGLLTQPATGVLEIVIDPAGNVESADSSGRFIRPTIRCSECGKKFQYQPAMLDGTGVRYMKRIQISLSPEKPNVRR